MTCTIYYYVCTYVRCIVKIYVSVYGCRKGTENEGGRKSKKLEVSVEDLSHTVYSVCVCCMCECVCMHVCVCVHVCVHVPEYMCVCVYV